MVRSATSAVQLIKLFYAWESVRTSIYKCQILNYSYYKVLVAAAFATIYIRNNNMSNEWMAFSMV